MLCRLEGRETSQVSAGPTSFVFDFISVAASGFARCECWYIVANSNNDVKRDTKFSFPLCLFLAIASFSVFHGAHGYESKTRREKAFEWAVGRFLRSQRNTQKERRRERAIEDKRQRGERREATRLYLPMPQSGPRSTGGTAKEAITGLSRWKTLVKVRANERIRRSLRSDEARARPRT